MFLEFHVSGIGVKVKSQKRFGDCICVSMVTLLPPPQHRQLNAVSASSAVQWDSSAGKRCALTGSIKKKVMFGLRNHSFVLFSSR